MASIKRTGFTEQQIQISNLFKALGHPARLSIVESLLYDNKIPCKNLYADLPIASATASRHIQVLFESGLIGYEKITNQTHYVLNPIALEAVTEYLNRTLSENEKQETNYRDIHFRSQVIF